MQIQECKSFFFSDFADERIVQKYIDLKRKREREIFSAKRKKKKK